MPHSNTTRKSPSLAEQLLHSVNEAHALLKQSLDALAESQRQIRIVLEAKYERPVFSTEQAQQEPNTKFMDPETLADTVDYGQKGDADAIKEQNDQATLAERALELALENKFRELATEHAETQQGAPA